MLMNGQLAAAIIAIFRETDRATQLNRLAALRTRDWRRGLRWLDASGIALYLRNRVEVLNLDGAVPPGILKNLKERQEWNKRRTAEMFREFKAINTAFQKACLRYVNLKGFTLCPDYCPDPSLRCQLDLDFMVYESDFSICHNILREFGYSVTGRNKNVVEFKAGGERLPSIRDLYKPRDQKSVEVHLVPDGQRTTGPDGVKEGRTKNRVLDEVSFPTLPDVEMFLAQAKHLFFHLKSEWTRLSWLLEFRTFLKAREEDRPFWQAVHNHVANDHESALVVGASVLLATEIFGEAGPPELLSWSQNAVPGSVCMWLERFGRTVLFSEFPGTKLYLLLDDELSQEGNALSAPWAKLFPFHCTPRVVYADGHGALARVRSGLSQMGFTLFRLRFHVVEGLRYWNEARRWKQLRTGRKLTEQPA
jgi:hypothetical protein